LRREEWAVIPPAAASELLLGDPFSHFTYRDAFDGSGMRLYEQDVLKGTYLKVAIALDMANGDLMRHGSPTHVNRWYADFCEELKAVGAFYLAKDIQVFLSAVWDVCTLNKLLCSPDYNGFHFLKDNGIKVL
jgi:hypothetical protein